MGRTALFVGNLFRQLLFNGRRGARISPLAYLDDKCTWGHNVYIDRFCVLHDVDIGDYSYIGYRSQLQRTSIGKFCSIASDVKVSFGTHPTHLVSSSPVFYSNDNVLRTQWAPETGLSVHENPGTLVGNDVWIGMNAIVMGDLALGDGCIVAAGAVVTKDVPPYTIVGGVPAKTIRQRFSTEVINALVTIQWWDWEIDTIRRRANYFSDVTSFIDKFGA